MIQSEKGEDIVHTISNNREIYDVGSAYPGAGEGAKGWSVRPLKRYVSWVSRNEPSKNLANNGEALLDFSG